jgi:adenylate cyclase
MVEEIDRYGGIVEKYAGDAVLALFGTPIAHEDDAERAVLCALGMQAAIQPVADQARKRWGVEPDIRVGVNTGEVVSGTWNASGRQDVAVTGDAVNTAARIQAAAEPGEVLVGLETMRLTRRRIRYGEHRELVLKGKMGTIPGYPALGIREQFGERWETSEQATPLIGRDREMVQLLDAWVRVQGGEGQLVTLVGDAGVGKSRLISELLEKIGTSTVVRVIRARCLSYGQEISLWLIADLLRTLFGVREQEALDSVGIKIRAAVTGLLPSAGGATQAEAIDVLGEVLGLPAGGSTLAQAGAHVRRQALLRSLRLILRAVAERAPTIIVLEDTHWIDTASQEVLSEILSDVPGLRMLVLAAQRPGWIAPWSEWGWTERLTLRPLGDEEAAILAGAVLGGVRLSAELERYVADRAGGNPFFVEEMLRALREVGDLEERHGQMYLVSGAEERLPSTLTEVLLARLDRLEGEVRGVAQIASVIGRSFAVRLLAQVVGREQAALDMPLGALQRAEIAFPKRGTDLEYVFKHVSMREVAYNTLVQKRRQELHLATARAIAQLYPSDEYVEMIAYHYSRTEEHREAVEWLEPAGDRAAGIYANDAAIAHYQETMRRLELCGAGDLDRARLDEKLGGVLYTAGRYDDAIQALNRAIDVHRQAGDLEAAGRVTALVGRTHMRRGSAPDGLARIQPMLEMLAWAGPSYGLASLHVALARILFSVGKYREMIEAAKRGSDLARAIGDDRLLAESEERRATALSMTGRIEESRQVMETALPLAEAVGDLDTLSRGLNNLAEGHRKGGDLEAARRYNERALRVTERLGDPTFVSFQLMNMGELLFYLGDWKEARSMLERSNDALASVGQSYVAAYPPAALGRIALGEGNWDEALSALNRSLSMAEQFNERQALENLGTFLAELEIMQGHPASAVSRLEALVAWEDAELSLLQPNLAWAHLELGDVQTASDIAAEAVGRARHQKMELPLVEALRVQAMVLDHQGEVIEAERVLAEAIELARRLPYPYAEARLLYHDGMLRNRQGEVEGAQRSLRAALVIFRRLGARRHGEQAETALAALSAANEQPAV